jgi:two-component system cell cycle response regulator CpdR
MAHIILAEDDTAMRQFLKMALTRAGHMPVVFENGVQAFDYLKNKENPADLLLTDIVMPEMDGVELAKKMAVLRPKLPVLFITGFGLTAPSQLPGIPGTAQVLSKPVHLANLITEIERQLIKVSA